MFVKITGLMSVIVCLLKKLRNKVLKTQSLFQEIKSLHIPTLAQHDFLQIMSLSLKTDPVVVDLLEVFVDGVIARHHGDGREGQVEHHQGQHVGHIVPAGSSQPRTKWLHHHLCHVCRH